MKYFKIWYLLLIFQELFVFAVPLVNYHALKRRITNVFSRQRRDAGNRDVVFTADSKCAECSEKLVLPHHMGCGHIFCFYCIKVRNYFLIYTIACVDSTLSLHSALCLACCVCVCVIAVQVQSCI